MELNGRRGQYRPKEQYERRSYEQEEYTEGRA